AEADGVHRLRGRRKQRAGQLARSAAARAVAALRRGRGARVRRADPLRRRVDPLEARAPPAPRIHVDDADHRHLQRLHPRRRLLVAPALRRREVRSTVARVQHPPPYASVLSFTVNRAPPAGGLSTEMEAPSRAWSSMMRFTTARPMPTPSERVV